MTSAQTGRPGHDAGREAGQDAEYIARLLAEIATLRELLLVNENAATAEAFRAEEAVAEATRSASARLEQTSLVHDLLGVAVDAVILLDDSFRVTYLNQRAIATLPAQDELVGKPLLEIFPAIERTSFWIVGQRVMHERVAVAFEDYLEDSGIWYSINVAPVGKGIAYFFRDITERRRRDAALQRTEKLAAVGRMASSISHEINNPLESVTNLLYLIENSGEVGSDMRTYAQLAASELARVSHIVTQTLKFHRQSTRATDTAMSEILESVLALYHSRLVTLHIDVRREYAADDNMLCFAGDMRQVFANLIGNALDAMSQKGVLRLRTRRARSPRNGEPGVRITVADNGCGMSATTQRSVFDAFFTTKGMTGSGLGMWVSAEIIRTHHGTIRVHSRDTAPTGTVFSIFFPTEVAR